MNAQNLFKYVRSLLGPLLAFAAAIVVSRNPDGAIVLRLPPIEHFIAHADLYASGLALAIEVGLRLAPSSRDRSMLTAAARLVNFLFPNRAAGGGTYHLTPEVRDGAAS
jgi:hypothetical protein